MSFVCVEFFCTNTLRKLCNLLNTLFLFAFFDLLFIWILKLDKFSIHVITNYLFVVRLNLTIPNWTCYFCSFFNLRQMYCLILIRILIYIIFLNNIYYLLVIIILLFLSMISPWHRFFITWIHCLLWSINLTCIIYIIAAIYLKHLP